MPEMTMTNHQICFFFCFFGGINFLLVCVQILYHIQTNSIRRVITLMPLAITQYVLYQHYALSQFHLIDAYELSTGPQLMAKWLFLFPLQLFLCVLTTFSFWQNNLWKTRHISENAIKEGIDGMNSGLCWYYPDGFVALKNLQMDQLSLCLSGSLLLNGISFEESIKKQNFVSHSSLEGDLNQENYLVMAGDEVWSFTIHMPADPKQPREMTAKKITAEYEVTRSLIEKQQELEEISSRLDVYKQELIDTVTSGEILSAKARIHDELGIALLAAKNYLQRDSDESDDAKREAEKEAILQLLRKNIRFLQDDTDDVWDRDEYDLMFKTARQVYVTLHLEGELPQSEPAKHVTAMAIHECITNTIRHAGGDEIWIQTEKTRYGQILVSFRNNGTQPKEEVHPTGGLLSLKEMAEKSGGRMEIQSKPEFVLKLTLRGGMKKDTDEK